ncbi:MAG TPA: helix-turn-helix transcriptional regulator [Candidatus Ruthenibacterium avium]|uniref:Helix-turn-helix transcriptional regulator n=1 Tax=Candidatus Ruthenibacterium avium TaxID=2838751 RepID=A0A9D2M387_9FIRM|nr:helix-turn-helix transcriptional regulator [Candidatus Ruthenibacterium avium]
MLFQKQVLCDAAYLLEISEQDGVTTTPPADFSVALISSGRCAVLYEIHGEAHVAPLCAGELLVFAAPVTITPSSHCHILCAGLSGLCAKQAAAELSEPLRSDGGSCPLTAQLLASLAQAVRSDAGVTRVCESSFRLLLSLARADETPESSALPPLVTQAVLIMRQDFASLYGIDDLSARLGVSKSHLVRIFHDAMGVPPGQYLNHIRLEAAKALLAHRNDSLEMVSHLCGFSGANYFCKVFKKHTGMTPAAFRAANTGKEILPETLALLEDMMYT